MGAVLTLSAGDREVTMETKGIELIAEHIVEKVIKWKATGNGAAGNASSVDPADAAGNGELVQVMANAVHYADDFTCIPAHITQYNHMFN